MAEIESVKGSVEQHSAVAPGQATDGATDTLNGWSSATAGIAPRMSGPAFLALQRLAGNAAVQALVAVQRDGPDGGVATAPVDAGVPLPGGVPEAPREQIDRAVANPDPVTINSVSDFGPATDTERLTLLQALVAHGSSESTATSAMRRIWQSYGDRLPRVASDQSALWERCNVLGANLPESWLGAGAGHVSIEASEQVGSWNYVVRGGFDYRITADKIIVKVGYNFVPDDGVSAPVGTWFDYIRSTWNHYSAVNETDPTQKRIIEFQPTSGSGHRVQVSAGDGRANAGRYFAGDTRAPVTIPHEFGHHIGLEDEYERDATDYTRVTGEAPQAGSGDTATAEPIARRLHDALFLEEELFEWHSTATQRRRAAFDAVMNAERLPVWGNNAKSREVSQAYQRLYGHPITQDLAAQCDTDSFWGTSQAWRDWRESVAASFQYTNTSIMGDMSDHTHPVAPRHVRRFATLVQDFLGHGNWNPVQDH